MHVLLVDVNLDLKYDRCFSCGSVLICYCTVLSNITLDDILFMFSLLEHKVAHSWKRTGPSQCHRMCLQCQAALSSIKRDLVAHPLRRRRIRYHREHLPDFLSRHELGTWVFVDDD